MFHHVKAIQVGASAALFGFLSIWATVGALAQSSPGGGDTSVSGGSAQKGQAGEVLEEVVVQAQLRSENPQTVPISMVVIGEEARAQENINSFNDLSTTTPSIHIGTQGQANELYIRGIGSGANVAFDQSVGTFIDDIYHGRSRESSATFLDLDHMEILKGPQSTFFGNNAIAGALNVVTAKPTNSFDASGRLLYGSYGQYAAEGAVSGPLSDSFSLRLAATANGERGWLTNVTTGNHAPGEHNVGGRVTLAFHPNSEWDATLKIEGSDDRNAGLALQLANCPPAAPLPPAGFCNVAVSARGPVGTDNNFYSANPGQEMTYSTNEDVLTVNFRHWNQVFTSITGYYGYHNNINLDADGTPVQLLTVQAPEQYKQFSEELRVASPTGLPVEYLGGLYFQADHLNANSLVDFYFLEPVIASIPPLAPLDPYLPIGQAVAYSQLEHVGSVFGSVGWNATEQLKLSLGLRGSIVEKSYDWQLFYGTATQSYGGISALPAALQPLPGAIGLGTANMFGGRRTDRALMPSAKIQYTLDPQVMLYASYANGFKAGGFNGFDNTGVAANLPFKPERVNAYEAGLKSEWLDRSLLLNLALFRSDYADLQVTTNLANGAGTFVSVVRNAASSRSQGAELEGKWRVAEDWSLNAEATYLDAYYRNYANVSPTALQQFDGLATQNLSGRPTEYAPRWSGSLSAAYYATLPGGLRLTTEAKAIYSASYYLQPTDDPLAEQGAYTRVDGRLTLDKPDGHWAVDIIGENLNDRTILSMVATQATALGSVLLQKEQPRSVAVQLRIRY